MSIKFYKNGTTGETDGEQISEGGSFSNPIIADGFFPAAGVTIGQSYTVHVRADAGEKWCFVMIALVSDTPYIRAKWDGSSSDCARWQHEGPYGHSKSLMFFRLMPNTNTPLSFTITANGDETNSPDTRLKLAIIGGRNYA